MAIAVLMALLPAQAQLKGGVTTSVPRNRSNVYAENTQLQDVFSTNAASAGRDPLRGRCQLMPKVVQGRMAFCKPPDPTWQLVKERGNSCYYYAPYPAGPIRGRVLDLQQCPELERRGGRCAANPNHPTNRTAVDTPPSQVAGVANPSNCPSYYPEKWAGVPGVCGNPPAPTQSPQPLPWEQPAYAGPTSGNSNLPRVRIRRLLKPADVPPLSSIRSLAYFQPVIEELLADPVPDNYLDYLRLKLRHITNPKSTPTE